MTFDAGTPSPEVVADDHLFAAWLAETAGRRLLEVRGEGLEGKELKDAGDAAAHELLMGLLAEQLHQELVGGLVAGVLELLALQTLLPHLEQQVTRDRKSVV